MTCDKCGAEYGVGQFPFCKGGHGYYNVSVIDDQIEGGPRFFETLGHHPVWIESKSQLKREAEARNLESCVRHDNDYYVRHRKMQDECLRDTGRTLDGLRVR